MTVANTPAASAAATATAGEITKDGECTIDNDQEGASVEAPVASSSSAIEHPTSLAELSKSIREDGDDDDDHDNDTSTLSIPLFGTCGSRTNHCRYCLCCCRCISAWPRTCAFFLGVILPIVLMILISTGFGYGLAALESPNELSDNDEILESRVRLVHSYSIFTNLTQTFPALCWQLYLRNVSASDFLHNLTEFIDKAMNFSDHVFENDGDIDIVEVEVDRTADGSVEIEIASQDTNANIALDAAATTNTSEVITVNTTEVSDSLWECGFELEPLIDFMYSRLIGLAVSSADVPLTFNWNRCPTALNASDTDPLNRYNDYINSISPVRLNEIVFDCGSPSASGLTQTRSSRPKTAQAKQYALSWKGDADRLYEELLTKLLEEFPEMAERPTLARAIALDQAFAEATGSAGCFLNVPAAVWFWFTVMTTVGYGNTAPITADGRAMVFTLGFLSILIFGGLLALAGAIVRAIYDDFLPRFQLHWLRSSAASVCFWGGMAYLWMLVMAVQYKNWRAQRLGDDSFTLGNGYWFAFISSTTVGLGDFHLDSEVITTWDLILFPIVFLIAFVLWSGFLGFFADLLSKAWSGEESLAERLHKTNLGILDDNDSDDGTSAEAASRRHDNGAESDLPMVSGSKSTQPDSEEQSRLGRIFRWKR